MMLLDSRYAGYEYASISADEIMRYAAHIKNNYSEEQKERLFDIIDYLEKVFPEKDRMLKKVNIPIVLLAADTAMGMDYNAAKNSYRVGPMYFRQWFSYFFAECYDSYKEYCSSGSIKKEKTLKRLEIMEASLVEYFELEETTGPNQNEQKDPQLEEDPNNEIPVAEDNDPDGAPSVLSGDSTPPMDTDLVVNGLPTENGKENPDLQEEPYYPSVAEDTLSYAISDQAISNGTDREEKPPEEAVQETE